MCKIAEPELIARVKRKAEKSVCRFKISAIGFDKKGAVLGITSNTPRFVRYGGGIHAEMALMARYGTNIKTMLICRVNNSGTKTMPIDPCERCQRKADELGIKIMIMDIE